MGKFKFSYKRFAVTVMVGAILAATTATAAFSYAWFTNHNNVTNNDLQGSTSGAYFARGDGTPTNPYVINKPIHLYNLAWLQYIGAFDNKEPYFIIESDLEMKDWTLPPIGTTEHPFKGHLDGFDTKYSHGQTSTAKISNLTISNSFGDFGSRHPSSVTTFDSPEITGFFGVIEEPTTTSAPSVQNLYIDNLTVTSKTTNALTGLVAGRVNGQLEGIGINNSKLDIKEGTSKLKGYDNISKYTSVGYCTSKYETSYVKTNTTMYAPKQVGTASFNPTGAGGGHENDWGGSIDMRTLNRRLTYISAVSYHDHPGANKDKPGTNAVITSEPYSFSGFINDTRYWNWNWSYSNDQKSVPLFYMQEGMVLPLNIDEGQAFEGEEIFAEPSASTYARVYEWGATNYYRTHTGEFPLTLDSNTGYLVSSGFKSSSSAIRSKIVPISSSIQKSFANPLSGPNSAFDSESFFFSSVDTRASNSKTGKIDDNNFESFGYQRFKAVKQQFFKSMENESTIHGFHFMPSVSLNSANYLDYGKQVKICGVPYESYQFVPGGLNFKVQKAGYITAVLGSYYQTYSRETIFDLFKVERGGKNDSEITSIKQIKKVCKVGDEITYSFDESSIGEVLFDFTKVTGSNVALELNKAYYFEIPVIPGDYVIGKSSTSDRYMSYLMYLDIGANAGGTSGNKVDRTKIYEVFEQVNEEFKYPNGVEIVNFENAGIDARKFAVVVGTSYSGQVALKYDGNNNASVTVTESDDTGLGYFETGLNFTSGQKTQVGGTTTHTRTQRLTYFDYYRETELGTEALFTNVLQFSQTQTKENGSWGTWGEIVRSDYRSGEGNTEFTKYTAGPLTIFDDDGQSTQELPTITTPSSTESFWNSNVFTLQITDPTVQSIDADWIQMGSYPTGSDSTPYVFEVTGYKFTMKYLKDGASTSLTDKQYTAAINKDYSVLINP